MLLEILTICSLIAISPYYDCSESWEILLYDDFPVIQCNNVDEELVSLGCTKMEHNTIHMIDFSEFKDERGQTILEHELRHLQCKCDFH